MIGFSLHIEPPSYPPISEQSIQWLPRSQPEKNFGRKNGAKTISLPISFWILNKNAKFDPNLPCGSKVVKAFLIADHDRPDRCSAKGC